MGLPNPCPCMPLAKAVKIISIVSAVLDYVGVWLYGFALEYLGEIYPRTDDEKSSLKSFRWNIYWFAFLIGNKFVFSNKLFGAAKENNACACLEWCIITTVSAAFSVLFMAMKYSIYIGVTGKWWTSTGQMLEITWRCCMIVLEIFFIYVILSFRNQAKKVNQGVVAVTNNDVEGGGQGQGPTGAESGTQAVDEQKSAILSSQDLQQ